VSGALATGERDAGADPDGLAVTGDAVAGLAAGDSATAGLAAEGGGVVGAEPTVLVGAGGAADVQLTRSHANNHPLAARSRCTDPIGEMKMTGSRR
jgi:hypothetical protein